MRDVDDEKYCALPLLDGEFHQVDQALYPMLMEWDWHFDSSLGQIVRETNGEIVTLLNEELRLLHRMNSKDCPILPWTGIVALFGQRKEFKELTAIVAKQREILLWEYGYGLTSTTSLVAACLTEVLMLYIDWEVNATKYVLTDGNLIERPEGQVPSYKTVGEWCDKEFTGDYIGEDPEKAEGRVKRLIRDIWVEELKRVNTKKASAKNASDTLRESNSPLGRTLRLIYLLLREYVLP